MRPSRHLTAIVGAAAALVLVGVSCGGVNRGGSRDGIIEQMRAQGYEADVGCVGAVLDTFDDDALDAIDATLRSAPTPPDARTQAFLNALLGCATATTGTTTP